jgi:hypothetical protein
MTDLTRTKAEVSSQMTPMDTTREPEALTKSQRWFKSMAEQRLSEASMSPSDTTREALWTSIQAFARSDSAWHFQRRDVQALIDFEVAAGVAEVERRYQPLIEVAREVWRWANDTHPGYGHPATFANEAAMWQRVGAALASIDGAPPR